MDTDNKQKAHPLLYIIAGIVAINLVATGIMFINMQKQPPPISAPTQLLPKVLGAETREKIYTDVTSLYNSRKFGELFELMHPLAKIELDRSESIQLISKLYDAFGSADSGVYSHFEYKGTMSGKEIYFLFYKVKLSGGSFNQFSGTLTFKVFSDKDEYGFLGFQIGE